MSGRRAEYIQDMYNSDRDKDFELECLDEGPDEEKVRYALKKVKAGKAAGSDGLYVELIERLEEIGVEHLTKVLNQIYSTGHLPIGLCTLVFIAILRKPGARECGQHGTISLISQITKLLLRIYMLRIRSKIKPETAEEERAQPMPYTYSEQLRREP